MSIKQLFAIPGISEKNYVAIGKELAGFGDDIIEQTYTYKYILPIRRRSSDMCAARNPRRTVLIRRQIIANVVPFKGV